LKRLLLAAAIAVALFSTACGGGSTVAPPPPVGGFTISSLKGQYTFSMSGLDGQVGNRISRVGSFIADGNGNITGALEDVYSGASGTHRTVTFTTGNYTIQANGYGTLTLLQSTGSGLGLSIVLQSPAQGLMIQNDLNATSSGTFNRASATTPATFSASQINGNYVFDFSGESSVITGTQVSTAPASVVGQLRANGSNITGGTIDINDGNQVALSGPLAVAAGNTFQLDATNGNGSTYGRGTLSFTAGGLTYNFVFYLVESAGTRIKLMETDSAFNTLGDAVLQTSAIPTTNAGLQNSFVFLVGGNGHTSTTIGALAQAGRFTADGNGNLNTIFTDQNFNGGLVSDTPSTIATNPNPSYSIHATQNIVGSGRGTLSFTDTGQESFDYIFYLISPTQGVIQNISPNVVGDGALQAQTGAPFTAASVAGNYAFNSSGVTVLATSNNSPFEVDVLGQYTLPTPSGQTFNGAEDIVVLGSAGKPFIPQDPIKVILTIKGDGTQSNDYEVLTGNSPTADSHLKAYFASPTSVFLVGTDTSQVVASFALKQTP
jgi:hypothetical protein